MNLSPLEIELTFNKVGYRCPLTYFNWHNKILTFEIGIPINLNNRWNVFIISSKETILTLVDAEIIECTYSDRIYKYMVKEIDNISDRKT